MQGPTQQLLEFINKTETLDIEDHPLDSVVEMASNLISFLESQDYGIYTPLKRDVIRQVKKNVVEYVKAANVHQTSDSYTQKTLRDEVFHAARQELIFELWRVITPLTLEITRNTA
jgi:hypothetical protein